MAAQNSPILRISDLSVSYHSHECSVVAVDDLSFDIHEGECYGLVGESGCGKSTVAAAVVEALEPAGRISGGEIWFKGLLLNRISRAQLRAIRGRQITMVHQDPVAALNPSLTLRYQLHESVPRALGEVEAERRIMSVLEDVRLPTSRAFLQRYSHQVSGGQAQRLLIAMSLLPDPSLIIFDEPTTGLDVTVEAAVIDLIRSLIRRRGMTAFWIAVIYKGEVVESGVAEEVFNSPQHSYTRSLFASIPEIT